MSGSSNAAAAGHSLGYRRDIDGLRAVAVLSVAFYHARLPGFGGGFVGVDVFFVISGYLITQILLAEIERGAFSVLAFYERRVRRIFPALFAVLLAVLAAGCVLLLPDDLVALAKSTLATVLFAANFHFLAEAGYFAAPSWSKPLLHTWSLAVEEQFYIVFPGLLLFARRRLGGRYIAATLITVLVSFAVCVVGTNNFRDADFFLAPTRAWELGLGSLLALGALAPLRARAAREALAAAGLLAIAYAVASYSDDTKFPGVSALAPCLGATAILWAGGAGESMVGRLLSTGPAVFVGLISYSLYLWHWPLLVYASYVPARALTPPEACVVLAVSVAVAAASWRFVERPFRGARSRIGRQSLFRGALGVSLATAAAALALAATHGLPGRVDETVRALVATKDERDGLLAWCNFHRSTHGPELWARELGDPAAPDASFVVWGDSHACMFAEAIDSLARKAGRRGHLAAGGGCPPFVLDRKVVRANTCATANDRVLEALRADPGLADVIMAGRWALYFEGRGFGQERVRAPLEMIGANATQDRAELLGGMLEHTAAFLAKSGHRVWVIGPVPEVGLEVPLVLARARMLGRSVDPAPALTEFEARQHEVLAILARLRESPGVHVVLPHERLCGERLCDVVRDGAALYWDDDHLSRAGVGLVEPLFEPIFAPRDGSPP
ncbi:MAG TPA: acyltransferase family protein [Myxococcota bacterium]|nr:acyltransferase family protein [Myxococcota bacterium]